MEALSIAVCTFDRIFDTEPKVELVSLDQLIKVLTRFALKEKQQYKSQKEMERVNNAWEAWRRGKTISGKHFSRLARAHKKARQIGADPNAAAEAEHDHMVRYAHNLPKNDLRVWSPALYPQQDTKRGSDNVIHVSCLVLDFDEGYDIEAASDDWQDWFHIVHTTWSHTVEKPKFRMILPLAMPVRGIDWLRVWKWADHKSGGRIDQAAKAASNTFALPAVANASWPRRAFARPAALFNPFAEGLVSEAPAPTPPIEPLPDGYFHHGEKLERFVTDDTPPPRSSFDDEGPKKRLKRLPDRAAALVVSPTPITKMEQGLQRATPILREILAQLQDLVRRAGNFVITEVQLELSFDADGNLLGFGAGGAITIKVRFKSSR